MHLLMLLLLAQAPQPIMLFFDRGSCAIPESPVYGAQSAAFFTRLEASSKDYGIPVVLTLRRDKADYIVQWGHYSNFDKRGCEDSLTIADGPTGRVLYRKAGMAVQDTNKIKDFFAALKSNIAVP